MKENEKQTTEIVSEENEKSEKKKIVRQPWWPDWFTGRTINEPIFCREFLTKYRLAYTENSFFSVEGKVTDENALRAVIYRMVERFVVTGVSKKVDDIVKALRITAQVKELLPQTDGIHVRNGTLFLDGTFTQEKNEIVRYRLPISFNPNAKSPERWLRFISDLLRPEDIPTLQEFIGYCLIPSNAGQKMLVIKGSGGEGKSQICNALSKLFGAYAKDGSVGKISENRFARADLEHVLLMIDDDMRLEALRQTNYVKSIVTAKSKMDLERKGKQSYQGWMTARIMAFSNGDLMSLFDRSDGFFRRQLILTTKRKPPDRADDPELADKLCEELDGIFLWDFEGLQRLVKNNFRFTESDQARVNREAVKKDANNVELFLESKGYITRGPDCSISSKELGDVYHTWCEENAYPALKSKTLIEQLVANQEKYGIQYTTHLINSAGRQVRGFKGIGSLIKTSGYSSGGWQQVDPDDNPFKT